MKKILLSSVSFAGLFLISCGSDDDGVESNNAPSEAVLAISGESGLSIDLTWDEAVDIDGDIVAYDLYANDEIVEANLTTVNYTWTAEGQNDIVYPLVFTVVSKDANGAEATSNEVELDDPVIGLWSLTSFVFLDEMGEFFYEEEINECTSKSYVEFMPNGTYMTASFFENYYGVCEQRDLVANWENLGNGDYLFPFEGVDNIGSVVFEREMVVFTSFENIKTYVKKQD